MKDEALLKLLSESPDEAMAKLIEQYSGIVYSIVKSRIQDVCISTDIEDCVADVFSDFYIGINKYDHSCFDIKSFLCTLANNKATDVFRRRCKQSNDVSVDDGETHIQLADGKNFENEIVWEETRKEIIDTVLGMEEPDRSIIVRKYYYGESAKQIGKRLGISEQTVNTRAHRAVKKLKEILGDIKK